MDLISMLPLLGGWSFHVVDIRPPGFEVPAGKRHIVAEIDKPGWLCGGSVYLKHKLATVEMAAGDPSRGRQALRLKPAEMYAAGCVSPNPVGPWLSRYDETTDDYVIIFSPSIFLPFSRSGTISVEAPPDAPVRVVALYGGAYVIEDADAFVRSLHELTGGPAVTVEAIREMLRIAPPRAAREERAPAGT